MGLMNGPQRKVSCQIGFSTKQVRSIYCSRLKDSEGQVFSVKGVLKRPD
jgi:hypothetical protein